MLMVEALPARDAGPNSRTGDACNEAITRHGATERARGRTEGPHPDERDVDPPSVLRGSGVDAHGLLGQRGELGLRGADHVRPAPAGLLVANDHADVVGVLEALDGLHGVADRELVEVLDRQLVGGDITELLAGGPGSLGGVLVALAAGDLLGATQRGAAAGGERLADGLGELRGAVGHGGEPVGGLLPGVLDGVQDRKSTRLNSSHANISYAVF